MAKDDKFGGDDDFFCNLHTIMGNETVKYILNLQKSSFFNLVAYDPIYMPSSEVLSCKECGQLFDTVESLREHMKSEREDIENRAKGFSDG